MENLGQLLQEASFNRPLLHRLTQNLTKTYGTTPEILAVFLALDWREADSSFFQAYREILLNFVSVKPSCSSMVLHALVSRLVVKEKSASIIDARTIQIIVSLIKLQPSVDRQLMDTLEFHFPYHMRSTEEHVSYVKNVLELGKQLTTWKMRILQLVIRKSLVIDVELQNYVDVLDDLDLVEDERQVESKLSNSTDESSSTNTTTIDEGKKNRIAKAKETRDKLDQILLILFMYIQAMVYREDGTINEEQLDELFSFILSVFTKFILPTFKSRNLQMFIYYLCSLRPETFADHFLGVLFKPLINYCKGLNNGKSAAPSTDLLLSISYIGSFVARATFLPSALLKTTFVYMVDLAGRFLQRSTSLGLISTLLVQNALYIYESCQKKLLELWKDEEEDLYERIDNLIGDGSILAHCNSLTVEQFLSSYMCEEEGKKVVESYRQKLQTTSKGKGSASILIKDELLSHFPFDPIRLPLCRNFLIISATNKHNTNVELDR